MANVLKIKRSSVAGKLPLTTDLQLGELAINTTDGRLFTKKNVSATDYIVEFLSTDSAFKTNAVVATTANITLSATQTIDGVVVAVGDRVLVKDQSSAAQNGVYIVAAGAWTRAPDMDTAAKCAGAKVSVNSGTTNGGRCFDTDFKSTDTLGTTSMTWARALDMGAIGVDVQAYDADLSAIAGLAGTSGLLKKTAANTWTLDTTTYASTSSSNVFTANQDFGNGTAAVYLDLNGIAGSDRALVFKTAGVTRWTFNTNTSAESGSNAGSNFELYRHTDAGAYIDTVMSCNRATGITNFKELSLGTDLAVQYGGTGVSTLTGIVKGNGTSAFSAAVAGTDYVTPAGNVATATQLATSRNINGVGFNGTADILVPSIYDSNYRRITNPGGAEYVTTTASVTGALQVTLPVGYTNTMMRMTIKVFNYITNESFDVICGGYNYSTSPSWVNTFAYILGNPGTDRRFTVRFGYTAGGKCCVYIGELATVWTYPQFFVTDVQLGYSGQSASWVSGWATSVQASAFENVTSTLSAAQVGYATSTNVAGAAVLRDGSGNFSAGTITASLNGNAATVSNITRTTDTTTDLNSLTTSGFYRVNTNTNTPFPYGQMITAYGGGDTIGQLYFNYTNGYIYTRAGNPAIVGGAGSWSAWRTVLNDANVSSYVNSVPTGAIMPYAAATAPTGWLLCYGQAVSRTTYAALFALVGTTYGAGDGSTTFNVPDLRGRVPAGQDNMGGTAANRITAAGSGITGTTLGASGGAETHTLVNAQLSSHTHSVSNTLISGSSGTLSNTTLLRAVGNTTSGTAGSGNAHNNTQPTIITTYIIKT